MQMYQTFPPLDYQTFSEDYPYILFLKICYKYLISFTANGGRMSTIQHIITSQTRFLFFVEELFFQKNMLDISHWYINHAISKTN